MKTKKSYGIACCRFKKGKPEILLILRKTTYAFDEFLNGNYGDDEWLVRLFSRMTTYEKTMIYSLNFDYMWYLMYSRVPTPQHQGNGPCKFSVFMHRKNKFANAFLKDGGKKLRQLLDVASNEEQLWEIPKGRRSDREEALNAAIREFQEETNISNSRYTILFDVEPIKVHFRDMGVEYFQYYYVAIATEPLETRIRFKYLNQLAEVNDIKWMDIEKIRAVCSPRVISTVETIFKRLKRKYTAKALSYIYPQT